MTTPHILVVDDTAGNRYAVSRLLRGAGMRVSEAENGASALRLIAEVPDLVVLDINLPDMTGYDVCRQIKSNPDTRTVPVMHLSASYTASADLAFGLEAGADAYLTHPLDPPVFLATARALLRAARAESESRRASRDWRTTFDAIADPIFLVGSGGTITRGNRAAAAMFATPADEHIVGRRWPEAADVLGTDARTALTAAVESPVRDVELQVQDRWYSLTSSHAEVEPGEESAVVCVLIDVTARRGAQAEREQLLQHSEQARRDAVTARAEAEAANRAKSDFLAVMSHELRTPLNAIGGFTDLIALGVRGPVTEEQLRDLDRIRRSQLTLIGLINDLLSFAKLESGSVHYEMSELDVEQALSTAAETMESQLEAKGMRFMRPPCHGIVAHADPDKLQQILLNLLSNAVKFTEPGGTIMLSCEADDTHAHIRVRDTGRGIPDEKLAYIFDPFMQVDQRLARNNQGVGLGLAISRDLARGMSGDLTVTSTMGTGSEFTLSLPVRASIPAPLAVPVSVPVTALDSAPVSAPVNVPAARPEVVE